MIRTTAIVAAALLLASCNVTQPTAAKSASPTRSPGTTVTPPAATARSAQPVAFESLEDFAKRIKVDCTRNGQNLACIGGKPENGDIYDVEMTPDCGPDGFFGGVASDTGAELRDALPPKDEATLAVLPKGQLFCIQAIGRAGQQPEYFYVTTIRTSAVAACKGNRLCDMYGDRRVDMRTKPVACPVTGDASCAAGWIDADAVESFDNGM